MTSRSDGLRDTGNPPLTEQQQKFDRETTRRWRSEAITAPAQDRLWLNRCEALCNALLDALSRLEARDGS